MNKRTADIGTIIHGTLRTIDLLEAFSEALAALNDGRLDHVRLVGEADDMLGRLERGTTAADSYEANDLLCEFFDALNEYAPDDSHFGPHDGDGADFGFWPIED